MQVLRCSVSGIVSVKFLGKPVNFDLSKILPVETVLVPWKLNKQGFSVTNCTNGVLFVMNMCSDRRL